MESNSRALPSGRSKHFDRSRNWRNLSAFGGIACALALTGCAKPQVHLRPIYPPAADLADEAKPVASPDIVTSAQAAAEYDAAVEAWGERGWNAVGRICRWAVAHGMPDPGCKKP